MPFIMCLKTDSPPSIDPDQDSVASQVCAPPGTPLGKKKAHPKMGLLMISMLMPVLSQSDLSNGTYALCAALWAVA